MLHLSSPRAAWGFGFTFETDDVALAHVMQRAYGDLPAADGPVAVLSAVRGDRRGFHVTVRHPNGDVEQCGDGRRAAQVLELLCWEINRRARLSMAQRTVLHAVTVAGPLGAVVLCGASHSGKSTLAAAAASRGWRHLSDDLSLIDVQARTVAPFARPVMLRAGGRAHLQQVIDVPGDEQPFFADEWFLSASQLGAEIVHEPQPLLALCLLEWGDEAVLRPITRATLLHGMALQSATIELDGEARFAELVQLAERVPGYRLQRANAVDALDLLTALIGAG